MAPRRTRLQSDNTSVSDAMQDVTNDPEEFSDSEPLAEIVPNIVRDLIAEVPSGMSIFSIDGQRQLRFFSNQVHAGEC